MLSMVGGANIGGTTDPGANNLNVVGNTTTATLLATTSITDSALTAGRVTFAGTAGILTDDGDMTFSTDTLTVTKLVAGTSVTISGLTATRVPFASTGGLLVDDSDLTFATDTLTATKLVGTTSVTTGALTVTGTTTLATALTGIAKLSVGVVTANLPGSTAGQTPGTISMFSSSSPYSVDSLLTQSGSTVTMAGTLSATSVGVGTATPSSILEIYGDEPLLKITQNPGLAGSGLVVTSSSGGDGNVSGYGFRGGANWIFNDSVNANILFLGPSTNRLNSKITLNTTTGAIGLNTTSASGS